MKAWDLVQRRDIEQVAEDYDDDRLLLLVLCPLYVTLTFLSFAFNAAALMRCLIETCNLERLN